MDEAYTHSPKDVLAHFKVNESHGLTEQAVQSSRTKHGRNGI